MLHHKIPSGRFWIMPNNLFEKYKLNSRDFMVYCFLVSKKDKKRKKLLVNKKNGRAMQYELRRCKTSNKIS